MGGSRLGGAGSFGEVRSSLEWLANHELGAAVLDINLGTEWPFRSPKR